MSRRKLYEPAVATAPTLAEAERLLTIPRDQWPQIHLRRTTPRQHAESDHRHLIREARLYRRLNTSVEAAAVATAPRDPRGWRRHEEDS